MNKKLKCILIDPPSMEVNISEEEGIKEFKEEHACSPPIGLAYIAAILRQKGVEVRIIDAKSLNMSHKEVAEIVEKETPELVGVTTFTSQLRSALVTCRQIKEACPNTKVVVGGPHIHPQHQEVIKKGFIDFCVRGEGEITMLELVNAISNEADFKEVRGLTFKEGGEIIVNPERPFIRDLDTLPFPARDLLPNHAYKGEIGGGERGKFTYMTASRGCPFKCHFCSVPQFWPFQRRRSIGNVLDELEHIYQVYGIRYVRFTDEMFPLNRKWLTEFCQGMVGRGLSEEITWSCDNRVDTVSPDMLEQMRRANCRVIFYGIEFGNQRILDFSGKKTTVAQIYNAIDMTKRAGISPTGNFMLGYPTETRETIEDTIALSKSLDLDFCSFSIVTPFPGCRLYHYCQENDLLRTENFEEYNYFHPGKGIIKLSDVPDEELMNLYRKARYEYQFRHISDELEREMARL